MHLETLLTPQMAQFLLIPIQWFFIVGVILCGFILVNKKIFYHASCIILFSMLINSALKITFAIPLAPSLNTVGFAFPSGHMQQAIVFYGWLAWNLPYRTLRFGVAILLSAIGLSLVRLGYHNYADIIGAIFFGISFLFIYYKFIFNNTKYSLLIVISTSSLLLIYFYFKGCLSPYTQGIFASICTLEVTNWYLIAKPSKIHSNSSLK